MARRPRIEFPGAVYHVVNRGDRRQPIFSDDEDRQTFIATLGETCSKAGWSIHAFCLLPDHFHMVVKTIQPNLVDGMKWFLGTYTRRFNWRHKEPGHLFAGRYKAQVVESSRKFLRMVCDHVHLNPSRAKFIPPHEPLRNYAWSSFPWHVGQRSKPFGWLKYVDDEELSSDPPGKRAALEARLEDLHHRQAVTRDESINSWCVGTEAFQRSIAQELLHPRIGRHHFGPELRLAAKSNAEQIVTEELLRLGWTSSELEYRKKGDREKLRIAMRLRAETTVTRAWIADRLRMGAPTYLAHLLYWNGKRKASPGKVRNLPVKSGVSNTLLLLTDPDIDRTSFD